MGVKVPLAAEIDDVNAMAIATVDATGQPHNRFVLLKGLEDGRFVFFTNYDMVQMEMSKIGRASHLNTENYGKINVFNEYFGRGLSSIVFQELRESKSLAYSAYVSYSTATYLDRHNYVVSYIGTQANKLHLAVDAMADLMKDLPQIPAQFNNAKNSALKQIASTRITRTNIFFNFLN